MLRKLLGGGKGNQAQETENHPNTGLWCCRSIYHASYKYLGSTLDITTWSL
jgi:hypothetical protein